jgi:hypothetical protein
MKRLTVVLAVFACAAWADVPPPDSMGCRDKTAGAACKKDDGSDGSCVTAKCSRNDYSNGVPPTSVEYDCLKCQTGAAPLNSPPTEPEKKNSCAALPGEALVGLSLVLLAWRKSRRQ